MPVKKRKLKLLRNNKKKSACKRGGDDIKRLYSPFYRFSINTTPKISRPKMPRCACCAAAGLSPKQKSFVVSCCSQKNKRYKNLKHLAESAIKNNKIFIVNGKCGAVRKALVERGWVEKIAPNKMNLGKLRRVTIGDDNGVHGQLERILLANMVEKYKPNFVWNVEDTIYNNSDMTEPQNLLINKLKLDAKWTTKQGLCASIKSNHWFYIEDVADVDTPRTYNTSDIGDTEEFIKDYRMTACTSLLKWVLSMTANNRQIISETGKTSINVILFALNRCKEYLLLKHNKDIDRNVSSASVGQWNVFLKKYQRLISNEDVFQSDKKNKLPVYLIYARFVLKEIHKYRSQMSCEGCHNVWIIKPGHCSRGRGIRMASKIGVITDLISKTNAKYVIQKYIEEPLLIHETKFDIRQYYLVTSTLPLVIWMYKDCYLKFSSQKYNLHDFHESIHLTNNAVQRKYTNCLERHPDLPKHNMWELNEYKKYLISIDKDRVWDEIIYPGMKKSIIAIMLSCQDSLSVSKGRFELYGCDFVLDKDYKPWLIEINSCPDLNHTTQVTAKICPAVVSDIIKVVIDRNENRNAPTGNFECIYKQPISLPCYGFGADLVVRGYSLPHEYFYHGTVITAAEDTNDVEDIDIEKDLKRLNRGSDLEINEPEDENCPRVSKSSEDNNSIVNDDMFLPMTNQIEDLLNKLNGKRKSVLEASNEDDEKKSLRSFRSTGDLNDSKRHNKRNDCSPRARSPVSSKKAKTKQNKFELVQNKSDDPILDRNSVLKAASRILKFISQKEKEYST